ncbi:hypothetical protein HOT31_gp097 [Microbacterium phage Hendrix]|uniref:Uncharacterized protein n=1 Tax=Microbacterium phage Hendrix TaxID=2182341 RepID=A0A2U8UUC6_9CAUD|nr:hypothetical protein HOT31_gp097 [Microbacterium phage Hendrix]AWN07768.1 hypothetical protein PBI_HENDRIX_97 [Microbacterium phage Hendrix]
MFGINWSRRIRRATVRAAKKSTRWATKPYRTEKKNLAAAKRRRQTWRSR